MVKLLLDESISLPFQNQEYRHYLDLLRGKLIYSKKVFSLSFRQVNVIGEGKGNQIVLKKPSDVKVSDLHSRIYISDTENNRILIFDLKTKLLLSSIDNIQSPLLISIEPTDANFIYFTSSIHKVGKIDLEQSQIRWYSSENFNFPSGIVADNVENGRVYVADCSNHAIKSISKLKGDLISSFRIEGVPYGLYIN